MMSEVGLTTNRTYEDNYGGAVSSIMEQDDLVEFVAFIEEHEGKKVKIGRKTKIQSKSNQLWFTHDYDELWAGMVRGWYYMTDWQKLELLSKIFTEKAIVEDWLVVLPEVMNEIRQITKDREDKEGNNEGLPEEDEVIV